MFGNPSADQKSMDCKNDDIIEEFEQKPYTFSVSIPKVEPLCSSPPNSNEDTSNVDEIITSSIPFIRAFKVRDPIIILERCDKIWETLKVIKDMQCTKAADTADVLPSENTTSKSLYVKYQPVLSSNNDALPNFKLSVKATKKLFHCLICGKQYTENRGLRYHSERAHGIYIPPKRMNGALFCKRNIDKEKVKQKESNGTEQEVEKDNDDKDQSKKNEKSCTNISLQSIPISGTNTTDPTVHLQRNKSDMSRCISGSVDTNEPVREMEEKCALKKELKQNEKTVNLQDSTTVMCILCKQNVKDMKEHLVDYHKIKSPEFMLKNLNNTDTVSEDEEHKTTVNNDEDLRKSATDQREYATRIRTKEKRKLDVPDTDIKKKRKVSNDSNKLEMEESLKNNKFHCDICLGTYTRNSFYKHRRIHRVRGETKENFHLSNFRYLKSPLYLKSKGNASSNDASIDNMSDNNHMDQNNSDLLENEEAGRCILQNEDKNKALHTKHDKTHKTTCSCGRSFRDPHTLFVHEKKCSTSNKEIQPTTESSETESNQSTKGNSSDRDSGIGINITIKKKNNSYEIIDKDNGKENVSHTKDATASSDTSKKCRQVEPQKELGLSKYSENHSILKIQLVNEDIDIDIEDFQTSSYDNDIISSTSEVIDDVCKEKELQDIKIEQDDELYEKNVDSDIPEKKGSAKKKQKQSNVTKKNFAKKYNVCVCGRKFYTRKALEVHMNKHHSSSKLICGYCKVVCPNVTVWNKHQCTINEGKRFIDMPIGINCQHCSATLHTYKKFDVHMKNKHYDSIVPYQCFECFRRFHNVKTRKLHFDKEHGISTCSICSNKCRHTMLPRHKAYHYGLGFPCHLCKKTYSTKVNLGKHMARVHGSEPRTAKSDSYGSNFTLPTGHDFRKKSEISRKSFRHNTNIELES